jgi:hypothetical protein
MMRFLAALFLLRIRVELRGFLAAHGGIESGIMRPLGGHLYWLTARAWNDASEEYPGIRLVGAFAGVMRVWGDLNRTQLLSGF